MGWLTTSQIRLNKMMNRRIPLAALALLLALQLACSAQSLPALLPWKPAGTGTPTALRAEDRAVYRAGLSASGQAALAGLPGATVYAIDLSIAGDRIHATGSEDVRYTNRTGTTLSEIVLRLFSNLLGGRSDVSAVSVDGRDVTPAFELRDSVRKIAQPAPIPPGGRIVIHVDFSLTVPTSLDVSYGIFAYTQGVLSLAHFYPMVAVYDGKGWNEEVPSPWGDVLYNQASFYLVNVEAPADLVLAASGREVGRQAEGGLQRVTFADGPGRDFYLAASADYAVTSQTVDGITLNSYAPRGDEARSRLALETGAAALQDYSRRYAPYPYAQFNLVAIPTAALGIEYPGLVAIARDLYDPQAMAGREGEATLEFTVAHETGHQWFYNLVGNNQLDEPWLDESLTQFVTWQYFLDHDGPAEAAMFKQVVFQSSWDSVQDADIPIGEPVSAYTESQYGAIFYGRGPLFFMALEDRIGQAHFDAFLHDYTQTYSWGVATTDGLKQIAEKDCSCDLTPLFQEWVYSK